MINTQKKEYQVFKYGNNDAYGQPSLDLVPIGTIKMSINLITEAISENQLYSSAEYIGLTLGNISDDCVINYNDEKLKVLYTNKEGRFTQVWMVRL